MIKKGVAYIISEWYLLFSRFYDKINVAETGLLELGFKRIVFFFA